jgi:hypothetical protein
MKRILFVAVLVCFGLSAMAADLEINVNPDSPLLIPVSSTLGGSGPVAPYFSMNNLNITWKGSDTFQLLGIVVAGEKIFGCSGSGSALNASLFASAVVRDCNGTVIEPAINADLNVMITAPLNPACPYTVVSSSFYCDKLPVAVSSDPMTTYNIPATVTVIGETLDVFGNNPHRVVATKKIVIQ